MIFLLINVYSFAKIARKSDRLLGLKDKVNSLYTQTNVKTLNQHN